MSNYKVIDSANSLIDDLIPNHKKDDFRTRRTIGLGVWRFIANNEPLFIRSNILHTEAHIGNDIDSGSQSQIRMRLERVFNIFQNAASRDPNAAINYNFILSEIEDVVSILDNHSR